MGANQNVIIQGLDELPTSVQCEINLIIFEYTVYVSTLRQMREISSARCSIGQKLRKQRLCASLAHRNQSDWQQAFSFLLFGR